MHKLKMTTKTQQFIYTLPTYYKLPTAITVAVTLPATLTIATNVQTNAHETAIQHTLKTISERGADIEMHLMRDGELTVFKRRKSNKWQCRFKMFNGRWICVSTKQIALDYAKTVASKIFDEARYRESVGLAPVKKTFTDIAQTCVQELRADIAAKTHKKIYVDYIGIIEKYFIPFFGEKHIQSIKQNNIAEFERWRNNKMGKAPKSSTLMNFASAFSRVVQTAVQYGWLSERIAIPKMSRKGEKGETRPAFTAEEIAKLQKFMIEWERNAQTDAEKSNRPLLCDYVNLLLMTGMRHGTEAMNIQWKHCEWYEVDGVKYLRIHVNGKTGARYLIAKHECIKVLQRLHSRQDDIKGKQLDLVFGRISKYIFRNEKLLRPRTFNGIFSKLMRDSGLMWNAQDQNRTLYSLRHTYATQELLSGTDIHTLAKQMGTSVRMLEQHYSKLTATMAAEKLA